MPVPSNLVSLEVDFSGGYAPSLPALSPEGFQRTIRAGSGVFLRSGGKLQVTNGLLQVSATNVGARIFAADIQRASIAGGLTGDRLPFASLVRYQNAVLFFLSENTSSQLYLNETAVTGVTTSATAGQLVIAIPDGVGGYTDFDAGFDKPPLTAGDITSLTAPRPAIRPMSGAIGVSLSRWRISTNAIGPPADVVYLDVSPAPAATDGRLLQVALPAESAGQDGWIYLGTRWDDRSGEVRVIRYLRVVPRGTFTATSGTANLTAGVGTFWDEDLRPGDIVTIDGSNYAISTVTSDTTATIVTNFTGSTSAGKTMTMQSAAASWFDAEQIGGALANPDTFRPPRAAGVLQYAGRVFLWGVPDPTRAASTSVTGNAILPMLENNPEHVGTLFVITASGSDLVNVLGADGPLFLMTTTSLEAVSFTGDPATPYVIRIIAEPGFKATSNGVLYKDWFYGFNNRPLRTRARENIDVEFAEPVWSDMEDWDSQRVIVTVDPKNEAVLYIHDDGAATEVIPYMTQLGRWSPPLNFSARIIDAAVVNGTLYVTYLSGGNYRVNEWEGGTGIGGTMFSASQYYDPDSLTPNRIKRLVATGKMDSVSVYSARPGAAVPDVSNLGAATQTFTLSDTDITEPEIYTNIEGRAHAFRVDFSDGDGTFDKLVVRGTPKTERR